MQRERRDLGAVRRLLGLAALGFATTMGGADGQSITERVSVSSSGLGVREGGTVATQSAISADGRFVAFDSESSRLAGDDQDGACDVFVRDRLQGRTELVSVDSTGGELNSDCYLDAISADGRCVVFTHEILDFPGRSWLVEDEVLLHDRVTGVTECVNVDPSGKRSGVFNSGASITPDGRFVAFDSDGATLVAGDTNRRLDVFVRDRWNATTERVSIRSDGSEGDSSSGAPVINSDGRFVAFNSHASNLVAGDTNGRFDVFVHDRVAGTTERVSVHSDGSEGDADSYGPSLSADGRFVVFTSDATNLVARDTNGRTDVFLHDRTTGRTERVGVDSSGRQVHRGGQDGVISADGNMVAFISTSKRLDAGDGWFNPGVFVHDRTTRLTECVSVAADGVRTDSGSYLPSLSADGGIVAFQSWGTDLVAGDWNNAMDVFVHERCTVVASWSNYGAGLAGSAGVPALSARANPVIGTTAELDFGNSRGGYTVALLFLGFERASLPSSWGGELLVVPAITSVIGLPPHGALLIGDLPDDPALCGTTIDLQALEADPGAVGGVSFTRGLELVVGR